MATSNENKGFYKLSWLQRIGFGSGDLAQNLIFQTTCMYLLFFYTDIYGLDAVDVSVMFTVGNVANVIWDPIVGALIDKNNPKLGKYRAYLVFVGVPLTGFAILCFWNGFAPSLLYAYITYIAMTLLYTFINVPYGALNSSLTRDTDEITILTSVRMFMANCPYVHGKLRWSRRRFWSAAADRLFHRSGGRGPAEGSCCLVHHHDHLCMCGSGPTVLLLQPV